MILNYGRKNNYSRDLSVKTESGTLFIVSGPSGVGKTTVVTELLKKHDKDYNIGRAVTYTTKVPRINEVHGVDYHFICQVEFERKIGEGFFLEWSGEYGSCYGTPAHILDDLKHGQSFILVIDRVGAAQILEKYKDVVLIWIEVSSFEQLLKRLTLRGTESFDQVQARLSLARKEIEQELHESMYHYKVENNDLNHCVQRLSELILPRVVIAKKDII